jgi:hypothetical protein
MRPALVLVAVIVVAFVVASGQSIGSNHRESGMSSHPNRVIAPLNLPTSFQNRPGIAPEPTVQVLSSVTVILPDGNVSNSSAPIQQIGGTYTLVGGFTGSILDERNGSVLNGNGKTLTQSAGTSAAIVALDVQQIAIRNFTLAAPGTGILLEGVLGASVMGNTIASTNWSIDAVDSSNLSVAANQAPGTEGTFFAGDSNLTVLDNNLTGSTQTAVSVGSSSTVTIVGNQANGSQAGVAASLSDGVVIRSNDLSSIAEGIYEDGVTSSRLQSNNLGFSNVGISIYRGYGVTASADSGKGGQAGISTYQTTNSVFNSESFTGFVTGADLEYDVNVSVTSCDFASAADALILVSSTNAGILSNNLSAFSHIGLQASYSSNLTVGSNTLLGAAPNSAVAISTFADHGLSVRLNLAQGAPIGFEDAYSSTLTVSLNDFSKSTTGAAAISVTADTAVTVSFNNASSAGHAGFQAIATQGLAVVFNRFSHAGFSGINVSNVGSAVIENNTVDHAGRWGIDLTASTRLTVMWNLGGYALGPNGTGIMASLVTASEIAQNNATSSTFGLYLENCTDLQLIDNNGSYASVGLELLHDVNTTAAGNWFVGDHLGFLISGSSNLWVYHNNFIGDAGWANPPSVQVVHWDAGYPEGGNFWGNHTGPDQLSGPTQSWTGPDGVVDHPLQINTSNVDRFPLTTPWFGYTLTFTASGLHSYPWTVVLNGVPFPSYTATLVIPQTNGPGSTYTFRILPVPGYTVAEPTAGPYPDERNNISILVQFQAFLIPVTFTAYGLAPGTQWSIVIGSTVFGSNTSAVVTALANGSYNYLAGKVPGYLPVVAAGVIYVQGSAVQIAVVYAGGAPAKSSTSPGWLTTMTMAMFAAGLAIGVAATWFAFGPLEFKRKAKKPPPATAWTAPTTGHLGGNSGGSPDAPANFAPPGSGPPEPPSR